MSKLYYKIQKELLKELKESTTNPTPTSSQPLTPEEKQTLDKKVLELANNESYIKPILQLVIRFIKENKNNLVQFQKRTGFFGKVTFDTFIAIWLAYNKKPELKAAWQKFTTKTIDPMQKGRELAQEDADWNNVESQIYFLFYLYGQQENAQKFDTDNLANLLDDRQEDEAKSFRIYFKNTIASKTLLHKTILDALQKLLGRVGKDPDIKTPALNLQAAYLPILSRFQSTIDRLITKNEKELQQPGAANKPELTNNLQFLKASEEVVEAIRDYISLKKTEPPPTSPTNTLQEEEKDPPPTDFISNYGDEGDFKKVLGALKNLEKFVPGISTFFNDMKSTDLDEIGRSKELQGQFQKAIRATLSTVGREVDKFSGKGKFSVTAGELKAVLEKYEVKENIEPIINNTVRAYKALAEKISSKETVKDFLEAIAKNASKIAPRKIELGIKMEELPAEQKPVKIALEVLEGKHFEKIKKTEDSIQSIGDTTKKDEIQDFYDKKKSKLRSKFALFYDKKSTQKEVAFEFEDDNRVLNLKVDGEVLKFTFDSLLPALSPNEKQTFSEDLERFKDVYKDLLKLDLKLDFKGEARVGIGSEQKEIKMFKFFNGKFEGYEDPETVSPANFILELLENEEQGRPYGDAIVKFSGEVNTSVINAASGTDYEYFEGEDEDQEVTNGSLIMIVNDPRLKILFNKFIYNLSLELEQYYKEKEMMDDLYDLFLKLYKEKNIDPNKRSDIVALGIVFDRNFQVKSFQGIQLDNKRDLLKKLLEKTLPGLEIQELKPIGSTGDKFNVKTKHTNLPWNDFAAIPEGAPTYTPELAQVFNKYSSKQDHVFEFQIDFSETEIEKMKERQEQTLGELWDKFEEIKNYANVASDKFYTKIFNFNDPSFDVVRENLTSKLETLINEFINKRKQQWRKRTM